MKKYRVVTDNLDWVGVKNGVMVEENEFGILKSDYAKFNSNLLKLHPDWFEQAEEEEFTREDMMGFARYVNDHLKTKDKTLNWLEAYLDNWIELEKL